MAVLLAKHPDTAKYDLSSVEKLIVGGAPLKEELIALLLKKIPDLRFIQGVFH